ncbi:ABC transporter substrate-binding protein [Corynebacterium aquatimens]|uniref:ABC-type nitrate/sulfonate/bicarbonate transport system substrate-binding protein n=1 Tax=Corynebacterium aquatimens TaxID=1190508 RepID=A0A931GWJ9_9CORY|nr:ABC transporter substrate-binding protein [Corynebacterium aquatimens]MBG6122671.1 ABC-type nitrate/sulfonate/bicarbonate transport system substrate-binding protein [Corynebacterium aquatimens]WJY64798.1 Putative thiamine biosynthesis protein [Corynebacterium aquatimens]
MTHTRSRVSQFFAMVMALLTVAALATTLAACSDGGAGEGEKILFAPDWTPNTNQTGLFVAKAKGFFEDTGIDVEILPYNEAGTDVLVDSGQATFGMGTQDRLTIAKSAGADIKSVMAVEQHWATEIAVLADRADIKSPKDLDGKTFGGFGEPADEAILKGVIQAAGGKGEFDSVVLNTNAYEALYNKEVDFTIPYVAWESIEAKKRGIDLKGWRYTDFGFPDNYQIIIFGNQDWMAQHPEETTKFVQAVQRGYQYAIDNPEDAAKILQEENPELLTDLDLLIESQKTLSGEFMRDADGKFGRQTEKQWADLGAFLYDNNLLVDRDGKPLANQPEWKNFFTNEYLAD